MPLTVWIAADTLDYQGGGGHFWSYLNWALGLQANGCEVVWLEPLRGQLEPAALATLLTRLGGFGLSDVCLYTETGGDPAVPAGARLVSVRDAAEADLLLNMAYELPVGLFGRFARTALLDIDPGMTQTWVAAGDVQLAQHDVYFTTGEAVARGSALVPETGIEWKYTPPCVSLEHWTVANAPADGAYSTVTHWWGDASFVLPDGRIIDNSKRAAFLPYLALPARTQVGLELAVAAEDLEDDVDPLRAQGWSLVDPAQVTATPELYRRYLARSRGEFSCAKPAYVELATGWVSDRTVCYLASGRPAIVQHTGSCQALENAEGQGIFRFREPDGAAVALVTAERDHPTQAAHARKLAEECFDARKVAARVLELSLA